MKICSKTHHLNKFLRETCTYILLLFYSKISDFVSHFSKKYLKISGGGGFEPPEPPPPPLKYALAYIVNIQITTVSSYKKEQLKLHRSFLGVKGGWGNSPLSNI